MNKKKLTIFGVSLAVFLIFLFATSPYRMPLILVVVPEVSFIVALYCLLGLIVDRLPLQPKVGKGIVHVLTVVMAVVAVLLSVGQFTFRDFALLVSFALIGMFYLSRMLDR